MNARLVIRILALAAVAAGAFPLAACRDTVVFGAQREIDVAISVNEDTAEPVVVNIGLNSKMAGLVPAIGDKRNNQDTTTTQPAGQSDSKSLSQPLQKAGDFVGLARPEGEAASMFSGFRYVSSSGVSLLPGKDPIHYDAEIRSQFASGAAAVIIAGNPIAVQQVVDVDHTFVHSADFLADANVALRDKLVGAIDGLATDKVKTLYDNPPTTNSGIEAYLKSLKEQYGVTATCDASDTCRRDVLSSRISAIESLSDLQKWEAAFAS